MLFSKQHRPHTLNGILFSCLFALSSFYLADLNWIKKLGVSPLVIAIVLGMVYGSTLRQHLPQAWTPGIQFVAKRLLRVAIVFYGFRLTFQDVISVGWGGFCLDALVVVMILFLGTFLGVKILKMDRDTSMLVSSGAAICGAAAVLAVEGVLKSEPHKAAVAVISVVLFGTIAMFLYPMLYHFGWLGLDAHQYGIYTGATIHEVAQVVVAGSQVSVAAGNTAVIVKMTRVMWLAPVLLFLSMTSSRREKKSVMDTIPWFVVAFILVVGVNSFHWFSDSVVEGIRQADLFLLTLSMAALGIETNFSKIKTMGLKPFYLAFCLCVLLMLGGLFGVKWLCA